MHYKRKQPKSKSRKSRNKKGGFWPFTTTESTDTTEEPWWKRWFSPPSVPDQTAVQRPGLSAPAPAPAPAQTSAQSAPQMSQVVAGGRRKKTKKYKK